MRAPPGPCGGKGGGVRGLILPSNFVLTSISNPLVSLALFFLCLYILSCWTSYWSCGLEFYAGYLFRETSHKVAFWSLHEILDERHSCKYWLGVDAMRYMPTLMKQYRRHSKKQGGISGPGCYIETAPLVNIMPSQSSKIKHHPSFHLPIVLFL